MHVSVSTDFGELAFQAPTLEVARLIASTHGFHVDVEPGAPGHCKLSATRDGATIVCNGTCPEDAAAKLIRGFAYER
jgi:hypothetical protein